MAAIQAIAGRFARSQPVPGAHSPIEWGTKARVRELLGSGVTELTAEVLSTDMHGISLPSGSSSTGPTSARRRRSSAGWTRTPSGPLPPS